MRRCGDSAEVGLANRGQMHQLQMALRRYMVFASNDKQHFCQQGHTRYSFVKDLRTDH
jgi:transcription initiation factor IIE alpha subunit